MSKSASKAASAAPESVEAATIQIRRNYTGTAGNTLTVLKSAVIGVKDNPNFPDAKPSYTVLSASNTRLGNALEASKKFRSPLAKQETEAAQTEAIGLLDEYAAYVVTTSGSDRTMAATSGLTLKKDKRTQVSPLPGKVVIESIRAAVMARAVDIKVKALATRVVYILEVSTDGQQSWTQLNVFSDSNKIMATDVATLKQYHFRVCAQNATGKGTPSDSVSWVGQ